MKLLGEPETETQKTCRKLLKPQVEKRRRERMNRSLESLRTLLLQGPQHQGVASRRVEKAEVLEHTVLFLQRVGHGGPGEGSGDFQDGFGTCLQRASRFLRLQGEGQQLEEELSVTLSRHLTHAGQGTTSPISPHSAHAQSEKQCAQLWRRSWHRAVVRSSPALQHRAPPAHTGHAGLPHRPHSTPLAAPTNSQSAWRPWS
ncbi:hypothetical protein AAFF_G00336200 [Aldrovandia affinis]|uniref:Hairy and enhancer of split related-7 n=1 Tax=Aldrovandia affinis TaxID=143900 RepID=A0AAD7R6K3_9TELE|nr:hypothetical protein AAFF_G00336200 [Aldrovandia affinis]